MHGEAIQAAARKLIAAGINDSEVARRLGVPRTTVRDWRAPRYVAPPRDLCLRCWRPTRAVHFSPADYAELLGLYLGDGHITALARTERLRIFLDAKHVAIVNQTESLLGRCFPQNRVGRVRRPGVDVIYVHNGHLSCVFPQHGPGKKHGRPIDGCVFVNRTGKYEYLSYDFKTLSADIRALFVETCASIGVTCRVSGNRVAVYQRPSVALLWEHVGDRC